MSSSNDSVTPVCLRYMGLARMKLVTLSGFELVRRIDRRIWRRVFWTLRRSLSFGRPTMDVKVAIANSYLSAMSDVEVIATSVVACWTVVIKTELTTYFKEHHEHGRNYVVNLCLIIGGTETGWGAHAHWGRFYL